MSKAICRIAWPILIGVTTASLTWEREVFRLFFFFVWCFLVNLPMFRPSMVGMLPIIKVGLSVGDPRRRIQNRHWKTSYEVKIKFG